MKESMQNNLRAGAGRGLSAAFLKNIAIVCMFFDHLVTGLIPNETLLSVLLHLPGRVCAPIMCFFIAEGFYYTRNVKKYAFRLFIFALLSHFPYVLYFGLPWWGATSVMWGLFLGLVALAAVESKLPTLAKLLAVAGCCVLAAPADWNYVAVLWIVAFGLFRGNFKMQMLWFVLIGYGLEAIPALISYGPYYSYQFGILISIPLLALYNGQKGKQGKWMKWAFYLFYPVHLLLLYFLRLYIF